MCIAAWVWQAHPLYPFLLVFNRDELYDRPTEPVAWWGEGRQKILGGRDGLAGGTWLACAKNGRVAFLTNVMDTLSLPSPRSRGELPVQFLESDATPLEFAEKLKEIAGEYNGFNLVVADLCSKTMVYATNRGPSFMHTVSSGLHVLSNATLDSPWPKCLKLAKGLQEIMEEHGPGEIPPEKLVERLMRDKTKADRNQLSETGSDFEELEFSSIFFDAKLHTGHYRTRSTTVVAVRENMGVTFFEENLEGELWKRRCMEFQAERVEK